MIVPLVIKSISTVGPFPLAEICFGEKATEKPKPANMTTYFCKLYILCETEFQHPLYKSVSTTLFIFYR